MRGGRSCAGLAENISRDLYVHIMEQYHPDAHVGKKRRVTRRVRLWRRRMYLRRRFATLRSIVLCAMKELNSVRDAAVKAGLWRFCEANENSVFPYLTCLFQSTASGYLLPVPPSGLGRRYRNRSRWLRWLNSLPWLFF